jgi:DNA polymerase-3 subunit epsilon
MKTQGCHFTHHLTPSQEAASSIDLSMERLFDYNTGGISDISRGLRPRAGIPGRKRGGRMVAKKKRSVVLDLETTGFSPHRGDRVIEIGAVAVAAGEIVAEFQSLIRVPRAIPWQASQVHGITDAMLAGQPLPEKVYPELYEFIGGSTLVAHNARFDLTFLRYELGLLGLALNNRHLCTLELARRRLPHLDNHRLETIARHLLGPLPVETRLHRAFDDARLTARVWLAMEQNSY